MAAFTSTDYVSASDISYDAGTRTYTVTGNHVISGSVEMTDQEKGATYVYSGAGRFAIGNGASGTIGSSDSIVTIIEAANRTNRYGGDNFNNTTTNASPACRFFGSNTGANANTLTLLNVDWVLNVGSTRDDFDIHQNNSDGTTGNAMTWSGVNVLLQGSQWSYPHCASRNVRFVTSPQRGFSMKVEQRSGVSVSFEFVQPLVNTASGLVFVEPQGGLANRGSLRPTQGGNSEQIAFNFQNTANLEMSFAGLVCRSIGTLNANSTNKLILIDPNVLNASNQQSVGNPGRPNGGRDEGKLEVRRTQRINFTGDGIRDGATIYADTTSTNADASNATGTTAGNAVDIVVPTHITLDESNSPTAIGTFRVIANDYSIRKATTAVTTALGTGTPAPLSLTTVAQHWPDGSGPVTELTGTAAATNVDQIYQRLAKYEIDNRNEPAWNSEITWFDSDGAMHINSAGRLDLGPVDQSQVVVRAADVPSNGLDTYRVKCNGGNLTPSSKGITKLVSDAGAIANSGNNTPVFPTSDTNGNSALLTLSAASNELYAGAYTSAGASLHFAKYAGTPVTLFITRGPGFRWQPPLRRYPGRVTTSRPRRSMRPPAERSSYP